MKKVSVIFHLSLSLLVSIGCLNLRPKSPESFSYISNNPNFESLLEAYEKDPKLVANKMEKLGSSIKTKLLVMCSLSEKLQLKSFTKYPDLFKKLLIELLHKAALMLKIGTDDVKLLAEKMQLPIAESINLSKPTIAYMKTSLPDSDKNEAKKLTDKFMETCGDNLKIAITSIILFLNPSFDKKIENKRIAEILNGAVTALTASERNTLEVIIGKQAFRKIAVNLPMLTDKALEIIKEA